MSHHENLRRRFSSSSWSDLPPELLLSIVDRLNPNSDDLRSLHCVCKRWRSAIAPPSLTLSPLLPRKITTLSHDNGGPQLPKYVKLPFSIVPTSVRLLRRLHHPSWLVTVEQPNPGKVRLFHPLIRVPVSEYDNVLKFPENMSVMASTELSKGFSLRFTGDQPEDSRKYINKVLLWPYPYWIRSKQTFESSLLMLLGTAGDLVCLRLGGSVRAKKISYGGVTKFDDIALWKDVVVAVDRVGRLYQINYHTRETTMLLVAIAMFKGREKALYERRKRLFVDSQTGRLYLVVRCVSRAGDQGTKFEVFILNSLWGMWEKVVTLEDRVLFVSFDTCFFVPAAEIPGFENNCIVFPKDCFPAYNGTNNFADGPLFQAEADQPESNPYFEVGVYQHGLDNYNFRLISSCPGFPDVLWPPPRWIWHDRSLSSYE